MFVRLDIIHTSKTYLMTDIRTGNIHEAVYSQLEHTILVLAGTIHLYNVEFLAAWRVATSESPSENVLQNAITVLHTNTSK